MGKIYQFVNFLGRSTIASNGCDRIDRSILARLPEYFIYGKSVNGQSSFVGRGYFD